MTGDEMQKAIEFHLNNQATFEANQQLIQEDLKRLTANQERLSEDVKLLAANQQHTDSVVVILTQLVTKLAEEQKERREQADHDRRVMREIVQDLKDMIYKAHDRADTAHKRIDRLENPPAA